MNLLGYFFDEYSHLRVRRLKVDRPLVVAETFAGGGADGGDDHLLERCTKGLYLSVFLQHLHDMIYLGGIGDKEHRHLPIDNVIERLSERP